MITIKVDKVNRYLARYSPRARKQKFSYPHVKKTTRPLACVVFWSGRGPKEQKMPMFGQKCQFLANFGWFCGGGSKTFDFSSKKKDFLPKIGIFGQFWPGHAGLFSALLVGRLVVVARGLYLARHLFTLWYDHETCTTGLVSSYNNFKFKPPIILKYAVDMYFANGSST